MKEYIKCHTYGGCSAQFFKERCKLKRHVYKGSKPMNYRFATKKKEIYEKPRSRVRFCLKKKYFV